MMDNADKQKLLDEFETMQVIEKDAHESYLKASTDPNVTDHSVRKCFGEIAEDERHRVELVERIMNILRNCLQSLFVTLSRCTIPPVTQKSRQLLPPNKPCVFSN
jgi:hypothetical protein